MKDSLGEIFMERTRYRYLQPSDQTKGLPMPALEEEVDPSERILPLPDPKEMTDPGLSVSQAILRRRSIRQYGPGELSKQELSYLLWATQGVQSILPGSGTLRTVPSAGARHALETYLLVNRIDDLAPGLYRFVALKHHLAEITPGHEIGRRIREGCLNQSMVLTCNVTFIWAAVPYRMTWRYGERGYRYLHLDAGHVCQNLYLSAENIGCGVCAIAAFMDEAMNDILGFDGKTKFVIYIATVGKR